MQQQKQHEKQERRAVRRTQGLRLVTVVATALFLLAAAPAVALPIEASVGAGPDLATVVVEFGDGAGFVFEVAFDDSTPTSGLDLMTILETEITSFELVLADRSAVELDTGEERLDVLHALRQRDALPDLAVELGRHRHELEHPGGADQPAQILLVVSAG